MLEKVRQIGERAKQASLRLMAVATDKKNMFLHRLAEKIERDAQEIIKVNGIDLERARASGMSRALLDRLWDDSSG